MARVEEIRIMEQKFWNCEVVLPKSGCNSRSFRVSRHVPQLVVAMLLGPNSRSFTPVRMADIPSILFDFPHRTL